jgi:hypothetical protein
MRPYETEKIVHVLARIAAAKESAVHHRENKYEWPDDRRKETQDSLRQALPWLDDLGLINTRHFCEKFANEITSLDIRAAESQADTVREQLYLELTQRKFFVLHLEHVKYYTGPALFGELVATNFSTSDREGLQAGKCFALGRNTACVYHLMRAMEVGIKSLATALNVSKGPNWGDYLKDIERELKTPSSPRTPEDRVFFAECAAQFGHVKNAWRNPVMHIEETYEEEQAQDIFNAVKAFLRHLATRLKE